MALWGNKDNKTASGTIAITTAGAVTGTGTSFTTQAKVGNTITAGGKDYQIISIADNTHATVISGKNNGNGAVTAVNAGASYALSEKPTFVAHESAGKATNGNRHGDSTKVFGVDETEARVAANRAKGLKASGWVRYNTYVDSSGNTRNKVEVLVASGGTAFTAAASGDAADDAVLADA